MSTPESIRRDLAQLATPAEPPLPDLTRYIGRPVAFAEALVNPETGEPFVLYDAERRFLEAAFAQRPDGRLPYPELVYSAPKKSGKTTLAAIAQLYVVRIIGGRFAEGYCVANDYDQAQGRVFTMAARIVEASPILEGRAVIRKDKIEFPETGGTITALASDFASAAGAAPAITTFDELWGYLHESASRLWDEMVPVPTRRVSVRLTVSYAGFESESTLLEDLKARGDRGESIGPDLRAGNGMLMYWTHTPPAPWQTDEWREQMRAQLRPSAFIRMIGNRFTAGESAFVTPEQWAACVDRDARPVLEDRNLPVWVGLDASTKRDSTAIVACAYDTATQRVRLVRHFIFQPTPDEPLDFEATVERTLLELKRCYRVREVRYDPYQLVSSAQRLSKAGVRMVEFPQSSPNLTLASSNLYDLVTGRNLVTYPDERLRVAVGHAVAVETPRGWRIAKAKASHKVDVVVALGMAALAAVEGKRPGVPKVPVVHMPKANDWSVDHAPAGRQIIGHVPWPS